MDPVQVKQLPWHGVHILVVVSPYSELKHEFTQLVEDRLWKRLWKLVEDDALN